MKNLNQMAEAAAGLSKARCNESLSQSFWLGFLGGGYVALAGLAMLSVTARMGDTPASIVGLLSGLVFTAGLVMVVTAGGELFTGNCLMPMGMFSSQEGCGWGATVRNWIVVYLGNLVGSLVVVALFWASDLWKGDGAIAAKALAVAQGKANLTFTAALVRGIFCNWLVTLAVWVTLAADSLSDKIIGVLFPITIFVLSGYEHCIANMFFLPAGWLMGQLLPEASAIPLCGMANNLVAVTLGNTLGGVIFVPLIYSLALGTGKKDSR